MLVNFTADLSFPSFLGDKRQIIIMNKNDKKRYKRVIFFNDSSLGILALLAFGFSTLTEQDVYLRSLEGKLVQVVKSYVVILVVVIRLIQGKNHPHPGFEENARLPRLLNRNKACF